MVSSAVAPTLLRFRYANVAWFPAMVLGAFQRQVHPVVYRVVGRFEPEHQQRFAGPRRGAGRLRLQSVEQAAVGRVEPGLGDLAHRPRRGREVVEADAAGGLVGRSLLKPHPGLGDQAEDPLGAEQGAVRRRSGAGPRQAAALPGADRADRPHRLDQVVDVRIEGREVPAGPSGDPAAKGRVLERLRKVAQGEAAIAQLVF